MFSFTGGLILGFLISRFILTKIFFLKKEIADNDINFMCTKFDKYCDSKDNTVL